MQAIVYIVDDDASFRTAMERHLKHAGYGVATYSSSEQLLDRLPSDSVLGCILLDVQIPGLSGPALASAPERARVNLAYHLPDWLS